MEESKDKDEKWQRKSREFPGEVLLEPTKIDITKSFSVEILQLKAIMDAKLVCQNERNHKQTKGKWMINMGGSRGPKHIYIPDRWEECKACNV